MTQSDFWDRLKVRLRDVSTAAADFTEEQALIGKLKFEVLNIKRKIDRLHRDLGVRLMELHGEDSAKNPYEDDEVKRIIDEVVELEKQIDEKRQEIDRVAAHFRAKNVSRKDTESRADDLDDDLIEDTDIDDEPVVKKEVASNSNPKKTTTTAKKKPVSRTTSRKPKAGDNPTE